LAVVNDAGCKFLGSADGASPTLEILQTINPILLSLTAIILQITQKKPESEFTTGIKPEPRKKKNQNTSMDHPYIITSSHSINHLTPPRSRLLQDPTEPFNPIPSPTKTLLSSIRTATASTLAYVAANSTAAKVMHLIKVFQKIIFDRENTIALLTVSNKSANTRISSLASENEELKSKMENMAMQIKVLTQALQLQLEPKMVKNEVMRGKSERGMRRPSSFGGVGSARFSGLGIDDESVEPALARVVESRARAELSFVEPSSCTIDLQPEFAGLAMTSVIEEVEGTKTGKLQIKSKLGVVDTEK
jgi:hypothetical protein